MRIRCPHCNNPVEVVEEQSLSDLECPSCGSNFSLVDDQSTATQAYQPSRTIGHFTLIEQLGAGAFGAVWKAKDNELDRIVAIKIPRREQLSSTDSELFLREARSAAQLKHPNIVGVHEVGREKDTVFIVSDFIEGVTIADWLTKERPTIKESVELITKVAEALHVAHEKRIVHRDLKPANIMLDAHAEPHIMDFGLAKRDAAEITMTMEGKILGTPAYMSPEQAKGEGHDADRRADVYSLGVILFELLTGERPFRGNTRMLLHQVIHDEAPSPRRLNNTIPRDLETICLKCLLKEQKGRYDTARELADDLRHWSNNEPIKARPLGMIARSWRWSKRHPAVSGTATILLGAAIVVGLILYFGNRANLHSKLITDANALAVADGSAIPLAIANLEDYPRKWELEELQNQFASTDEELRLPLAYGLSHFGQVEVDTLIAAVIDPNTSSEEVMNIVEAMLPAKDKFIAKLITAAEQATEDQAWTTKARIAVIGLYLGEPSIAAEMLRSGPIDVSGGIEQVEFDPIQRTRFIKSFADWSGDLTRLSDSLVEEKNPDLRSGIALAVGRIDRPNRESKQAWQTTLNAWYKNAPDGGTHSASSWALRQWGFSTPQISAQDQPPKDRNWWHGDEFTMIRIPKGSVQGGNGLLSVDTEFWLSDREVTVAAFERFIAEASENEHPKDWGGPFNFEEGLLQNQPLQNVNWYDALMYCNWLSKQQGYNPCYELRPREGEAGEYDVELTSDGNGYRLPTEAEWEYACRARTTTAFVCGELESDLSDYAWHSGNSESKTHPVTEKRCSAWGLFDMHGNVWEWCWDEYSSDPSSRANRGGSFTFLPNSCHSSSRGRYGPVYRHVMVGFRVALSSTSK